MRLYYITNRSLAVELNSRDNNIYIYRKDERPPSSEEIEEVVLSLIYDLLKCKIENRVGDVYKFSDYYDIGGYLFICFGSDYLYISRGDDPKLLSEFHGKIWDEVHLIDCLKLFLLNERYEPKP